MSFWAANIRNVPADVALTAFLSWAAQQARTSTRPLVLVDIRPHLNAPEMKEKPRG